MASINTRFARHRVTPAGRTMIVTTLVLGWVMSLLIAALLAAEAMLDPGGRAGLVLTVSWAIPALVLIVIGFDAPRIARWILGAATGLLLLAAMVSWFIAAPLARFVDSHGPVLFVAGFAVWLGLLALGALEPRLAGALLVIATLGPLALDLLGISTTGVSTLLPAHLSITAPYALIGVSLLIATSLEPEPESTTDSDLAPPMRR